ncbi:MAG: thiamine phosphate synthase [Armatimonadetes bacterium]|nr:thiamine phosphate synthase [Armatimonadota bacterium]
MISEAKHLLTLALEKAVVVGQGRGYPDVFAAVNALSSGDSRTHAERLALLKGVYVITDPDLARGRTPVEIAGAAQAGGAGILQLRDKHLSRDGLVQAAQDIREAASAPPLFIVNDRVDVAMAANADGVHLGPDDMRPGDARYLLGPDKLIGVSTGTLEEARAAAPYASYFGVGAIFGSKTKLDAGGPVGVERIQEIKAAFPHIPVVAIGGINRDNIMEVARAGADAAAVVSAVVAAPDMAEATRELVRRFAEGKGT